MNVELIVGLLAQAAAPQKQPPIWTTLLPMVFIFVIFWVLLIRPQQKKQKALDQLVKELKVNDRVMAGGIVGVVVSLKDRTINIRSGESKIEVMRGSVTEILKEE